MKHQCGEPVSQMHVRPGMTVAELVDAMGKAGAYNGGSLYHAANIYEQMLKDKETTKFFGLAGAMVPAGMGGIVSDLIRDGHIDILVSTGANLTHDIIEANRLPPLPRHRVLQRYRTPARRDQPDLRCVPAKRGVRALRGVHAERVRRTRTGQQDLDLRAPRPHRLALKDRHSSPPQQRKGSRCTARPCRTRWSASSTGSFRRPTR